MVIVIFNFNGVVWLSNWCSALRWTPWRCSWGRWWTWWMWSSLSRQQWHTMGWEMFKCDINQRGWHWCFCPKHKKPLMWERLKFDQRFHFLPENKVIWSHEGNMRYLLTTDLWIFLSDCSCDSGRLGRWSRACWKNWKRGGLVVRDWAGGFCEKSILTFFHDHYQLWSIKIIIHYHCQCFADNSRGGPSQKLGGFRSGPTCSWRPLHIRRHRWGESSIKRQKQKPINKHIITNKKKRKGYFWQSKQIKCCMFKQVINQQTMNKWEYPSTSKVMSRDALHKLRWCELASKVIWQNCVKPMIWPKLIYKHPSSTLYAIALNKLIYWTKGPISGALWMPVGNLNLAHRWWTLFIEPQMLRNAQLA